MRHEMDILSSHRASYKLLETENTELKSKLDLMISIESVLNASQPDIDEILKQKFNAKDLAMMVGTLRRELNNNEIRKNELRKQLQMVKNDLRKEQDERRNLQDKLSCFESENHILKNKLKKLQNYEAEKDSDENDCNSDTSERVKRPRLAPKLFNDLNTSSPMTQVS